MRLDRIDVRRRRCLRSLAGSHRLCSPILIILIHPTSSPKQSSPQSSSWRLLLPRLQKLRLKELIGSCTALPSAGTTLPRITSMLHQHRRPRRRLATRSTAPERTLISDSEAAPRQEVVHQRVMTSPAAPAAAVAGTRLGQAAAAAQRARLDPTACLQLQSSSAGQRERAQCQAMARGGGQELFLTRAGRR